MRTRNLATVLGLATLLSVPVLAQEVIVYPAKGQSAEQTEKDKYECYAWAKNSSGFDPMAAPTAQTAPPTKEKQVGGVGKGAVGGGLAGLAVGALAGNAKKGAAIGAGSGALIGGMRRHDQKQRETNTRQQWEQQEVADYSQNRNNYNRAYSACLEGRGYTVR
jgi:hypothetical protein